MAQLFFQNGTIVDGSGSPGVPGSVLVEGDRILAAGRLDPPGGCHVVNCDGLVIAPGFIDLHSHSDLQVLEQHRAKVDQGVTTEVVGNCGFSPYPSGDNPAGLQDYANGILFGGDRWGWRNAAEYLASAEEKAASTNVVSLIGHGSLRVAVMGSRQEEATTAELDRMAGILDEALAGGAAGFSTGLMYAPGNCASRDELVTLLKVVARRGKLYATHMRSYSWELIESIGEQLDLVRAAGCRLEISHLQAVGQKNWHKQESALALLEQARAQGIDVAFDSYPYLAGSTVATQLLPQEALDGGIPALLSRLRDPDQRARLAAQAGQMLAQRWSDVYVASVGSGPAAPVVGRSFAEIGDMRGTAPVDAVIDLLLEEEGLVNILSFNQSEANLRALLTHPLCTVISDGFYVKGRPHPRLYGTFPELLGAVVRDKKWLSLEEAVHKVTGKPAAVLGLRGRGRISPGCVADITLFDAEKITSTATYESPCSPPEGVAAVYKSGVPLQ